MATPKPPDIMPVGASNSPPTASTSLDSMCVKSPVVKGCVAEQDALNRQQLERLFSEAEAQQQQSPKRQRGNMVFLRPSTKFRDMIRRIQEDPDSSLSVYIDPDTFDEDYADELELTVDIPTLIQHGVTFEEFCAMVHHKIVWINKWCYILTSEGLEDCLYGFDRLIFKAGKATLTVAVHDDAFKNETMDLLNDGLCRLFATSSHPEASVDESYLNWPMISALGLAHVVEGENFKEVRLQSMRFGTDHCRVLQETCDAGPLLDLRGCTADGDAAADILVESVRNNRVTRLIGCKINAKILAEALGDNTSVETFCPDFFVRRDRDQELREFARALVKNKGITSLMVQCMLEDIDLETWTSLCLSVKSHPKLKDILLGWSYPSYNGKAEGVPLVTKQKAVLKSLNDMLQTNKVVQTIRLAGADVFDKHFDAYPCIETIRGRLLCNQFRPHVAELQKVPANLQMKLVGRAMQSVRNDPDRLWMLLTEFPAIALSAFGPELAKSRLLATKKGIEEVLRKYMQFAAPASLVAGDAGQLVLETRELCEKFNEKLQQL